MATRPKDATLSEFFEEALTGETEDEDDITEVLL